MLSRQRSSIGQAGIAIKEMFVENETSQGVTLRNNRVSYGELAVSAIKYKTNEQARLYNESSEAKGADIHVEDRRNRA